MVDSAGGRSQLAQITASFIVLLVLLFPDGFAGQHATLPPLAVVFLIGVELIDVKGMRRSGYNARRNSGCVYHGYRGGL